MIVTPRTGSPAPVLSGRSVNRSSDRTPVQSGSDDWVGLSDLVRRSLRESLKTADAIKLYELDHAADGVCFPMAGILVAASELREAIRDGRPTSPVLIIGLQQTLDAARSSDETTHALALFDWPGAAYLPYGFSEAELIGTARRILEGANSPPPVHFGAHAADAVALSAEIRHWLTNRRRNTEGALKNFHAAACNERRLHATHMVPIEAISRQHRNLLARFEKLLRFMGTMDSEATSAASLMAAVRQFESSWSAVEDARTALRAAHDGGNEGAYASAAEGACLALLKVRDALSAAIDATRRFDADTLKDTELPQ